MGTDEFLLPVRETGARPIPLPKGRKAQRAERKQGYVKVQARVLKTIFPTSLPLSLVPHLVQASIWQINTNICKGNPGDIPPLLALERVSSFSFDRVYSPAFVDIILTHREDVVPDIAADYTNEAIALYPADTQEEGFYFYIPLTKDVVKRVTSTKCEVYTEIIIRALLQQYHDEM